MSRFICSLIVALVAASQLAAQQFENVSPKIVHTLRHEDTIREIAVSPDGKMIAAAGYEGPSTGWTVRLWDVSTGKLKAKFAAHQEYWARVVALCFSHDSLKLGYVGRDRMLRIWDVESGKETSLSAVPLHPLMLTFARDGKTLASFNYGASISLWDVQSGKEQRVKAYHRGLLRGIISSPDGKIFASITSDDLRIWDAAGNEIYGVVGDFNTMRFSPDGKTLTAATGNRVTRWNASRAQEVTIVEGKGHPWLLHCPASLSPDGTTLATIGPDFTEADLERDPAAVEDLRCRVTLMDAATGEVRTIVETRKGKQNWFWQVMYSPDGKTLALWNWNDQSVTFVDAASGKRPVRITAPEGERFTDGISPRLAFVPDGNIFAAAHGSSVSLWEVRPR